MLVFSLYSASQFFGPACLLKRQSTRQIPYAIGQFTINELCHEIIYRSMTPETPQCLSPSANFTIALGSGIFAGFAAAILSQPADTLFSQINKGHGPTRSMVHRLTVLARPAGFSGLFAGLDPRIIMTAGTAGVRNSQGVSVERVFCGCLGTTIANERK
ncbi:hypothetical protein H2248_007507 [Termitomyces sp. 'cryptogamus']|nr:hypothetical protein H2248_007507 [Termitomyces sp. 'cryptogamus']